MKRSWSRIFALSMGIPLLLALLAACGAGTSGSTSTPTTGSKVIKVATDLPVSGKDESGGKPAEDGAHLAVDQANANHTIPGGYTLQFVPKDDVGPSGAHDPAVGKANVTALISDALIAGIVGPFNSGVAEAEMPEANQAPIALVSPSNTLPCLTQTAAESSACTGQYDVRATLRPTGNVTYFRDATTDTSQGKVGANLLYGLGFRKAWVVDDAEAYGIGIANIFSDAFKGLGGTVLNRSSEPGTTTSFVSLLTSIAAAHPDVVYFGGTDATGGTLFREQFKQVPGLANTPMGGGDGIVTGDFAKNVAPLGGGATFGTTGSVDVTTVPAAQSFVTTYQATYGTLGAYSANAYDCMNILIQAIKKALAGGAVTPQNSGDLAGAKTFRTAVIAALKTTDYTGPTGHHTFDANGDTTNKVVSVFLIKNLKTPCDNTCWTFQKVIIAP